MAAIRIPKRVSERLTKQIAVFQRILDDAKRRDIHESNTVTIVTDMLADVFGFDKYAEITSEQEIRGTYCDLAVEINGSIQYLVEVKAIGLDLKESHLRQAVNYGANHGVPWVILTNGIDWQVHKVFFDQQVISELVFQFDFLGLSARRKADHESLFLLCRSGMSQDAIEEFHSRQQTVNRFVVSALIQSESILKLLRREIRKLAPDTRVTMEEVENLLPDVLKRDVLDGDAAIQARKQIKRTQRKQKKKALAAKKSND